jgi:hypothetical protein
MRLQSLNAPDELFEVGHTTSFDDVDQATISLHRRRAGFDVILLSLSQPGTKLHQVLKTCVKHFDQLNQISFDPRQNRTVQRAIISD